MAHYAFLDSNNVVTEVIVGDRLLDPYNFNVLYEPPTKPVVVGKSLVDPVTKQILSNVLNFDNVVKNISASTDSAKSFP